MADAVTTTTLFNGTKRLVVKITNLSDGTGESAVVKVDKSAFTGPNGLEPSKFAVDKIVYNVAGMAVRLYFDRTTDTNIGVLQGTGYLDFKKLGGLVDKGTGDTGDIVLTTTGHTAADSYDITIYLRKKD